MGFTYYLCANASGTAAAVLCVKRTTHSSNCKKVKKKWILTEELFTQLDLKVIEHVFSSPFEFLTFCFMNKTQVNPNI